MRMLVFTLVQGGAAAEFGLEEYNLLLLTGSTDLCETRTR